MRGFILLKPEVIQRNLIGKIVSFIEDKGFKIIGLKMVTPTRNQIQQLYKDHKDSLHFENLIDLCSNEPVITIAIETPPGLDSLEILKVLQGKQDITGTIRFYYSLHPNRGVLHCSSQGDGLRESQIFFSESEINSYIKVLDEWIISTHQRASLTEKEIVNHSENTLNPNLNGRHIDLFLNT